MRVERAAHFENYENRETPREPEDGGGSEKGGTQSWGVFDALKTCVLHATSIVFKDAPEKPHLEVTPT